MTAVIRHFHDKDHVANGSDGDWTYCGKPWRPQPKDAKPCDQCVDEVIKYADTMRQGQR